MYTTYGMLLSGDKESLEISTLETVFDIYHDAEVTKAGNVCPHFWISPDIIGYAHSLGGFLEGIF